MVKKLYRVKWTCGGDAATKIKEQEEMSTANPTS